jgi:hypothetical protein
MHSDAPTVVATNSSRKRPRHFHAGPDDATADQSLGTPDSPFSGGATQQHSTHISPQGRLYTHARELVCAFLSLADLSRMLAVNRAWASAVRSMKPLAVSWRNKVAPVVFCVSPLGRHVSKLRLIEPTSAESLLLLSLRAPHLKGLNVSVSLPQPIGLVFGTKLQSVNLYITAMNASDVPAWNATLVRVAALPELSGLTLLVPAYYSGLDFAPLTRTKIVRFRIAANSSTETSSVSASQPSDVQIEAIRSMPFLQDWIPVGWNRERFIRLLRAPHQMKLTSIPTLGYVDDAVATVLSTLPTLEHLSIQETRSISFLSSLVKLQTLSIKLAPRPPPVITSAAFVASLAHCTQLVHLCLNGTVSDKDMTALLPHLLKLRSLELRSCDRLKSLRFLNETRLQRLVLNNCCNLHATELMYVHTMHALTQLDIISSFAEPLDLLSIGLHLPPSKLIPTLVKFAYVHEPDTSVYAIRANEQTQRTTQASYYSISIMNFLQELPLPA